MIEADEIPTEALEAAARALFEHDRMAEDPPWDELADHEQASYHTAMEVALAAAAPYLIAEGRRQRDAEMIEEWAVERSDWKAQGVSKIVECRGAGEAFGYASVTSDLTVLRRQVTKWEEIVAVEGTDHG